MSWEHDDHSGVTATEVHGYKLQQAIGFTAAHFSGDRPKKKQKKKSKRYSETQIEEIYVNEGQKKDAGKDPWHLMPWDALRCIVMVLAFGAKKYGDRNWEKGLDWSRLYGALMRHLVSWWGGDKKDEETGYSHLWHAGCCILFLIAMELRGIGKDDRPIV